MLQEFTILHRRKPQVFASANAASQTWSTCLRSLRFNDPQELCETDEFYRGADAYKFLLEIVCGLHSPIVGETEVFGQFKQFAQQWLKEDPRWVTLVQRLLADAKTIRSQYLSALGNQSYGSWVRKNMKGRRVHMVGAGHLAVEILPYLVKQDVQVTIHARQPVKVTIHTDVRAIDERAFDEGALVIAAPMTANEIQQWLGDKTPHQIFDLRDTSSSDPLTLKTELFGLNDIFTQIEQNKIRLQPLLEKVKHKISLFSQEASQQVLIRPQGWDDICA